jgi:hypothetical protein
MCFQSKPVIWAGKSRCETWPDSSSLRSLNEVKRSAGNALETRITFASERMAPRRSIGLRFGRENQNMKKIVIAMLAAITFAGPALAATDGKPGDSRTKPSSFVPHPRTNRHIYGTPIQQPIVGHAKPHHKPAPKKPPVHPIENAAKSP